MKAKKYSLFLICLMFLMGVNLSFAQMTSVPDQYEDDDTFMNASVIVIHGNPQLHNFHDTGDEDWVKFYGLAGKPYSVSTTNLGPLCDTILYLYDGDGQTLIKGPVDNQGYGEDETFSWYCERDGVYYVLAKQYDSSVYGEGTDYSLIVYTPLSPFTGTIIGIISDAVNSTPVTGALIKTDTGGSGIAVEGYYMMIVPAGKPTVTVSCAGYASDSKGPVEVGSFETIELDFSLFPEKTTWQDVINKYQEYVKGNATWEEVINCYNEYALQ